MTAQTFHELPPYRVELAADFDSPYRKTLRHDVLDALERGHRRVEIDCSTWRQLDLAMLSALIQCAKACDQQTASFEMLNVGRDIKTAIEALRLDDRLGLRR
jgi:ABC-type transporter Mla MlaB component